ncbi:amino acid adenylation domain-containing protein [Stieleria marina]|uniref:amino acid adenylation domain-containing protein n=1 Tax=Stieleria marina TaxID=1930275 RepID=UPI003AF40725
MDQSSPAPLTLDTSRAARQRVYASVPDDLPTIVHHGRFYAAGSQSSQPVFTHIQGGPGEHHRYSFADLDLKARSIAAEIQSRGGSGQPVLIVLDPGIDYAAALYGCMYAGAIAVPVYPPQMLRLQHTLSRLQAIIANAGAKLMLSSRATIGDSLGPIWGLDDSAAIAVDEVSVDQAGQWKEEMPAADDVAILQYTSGSTGNPQGVVLRHRSILANLKALLHQFHFPNVRCVQWVPPYHDMGLVGGILVPVYTGVETVLLSPTDFVRDPLLWLRCIDHYRGTSNGAPNFGYELCIRKIKEADCEGLDLSSWKVAIAGAEPVRHSTLKRFCEKFAPFGFDPAAFCPSYGLAETTLIVSGSQVGQPFKKVDVDTLQLQNGIVETEKVGETLTLVSSGDPVLGIEVAIVDPDSRQLAKPGAIGEIWVRGDSLADGYWREPERTAESFNVGVIGGQHDDYLRTGDLGVMIDGELFVTGRRKELIIVAGKNLYPHDVEEVVQSTSPAFKSGSGTAFGVETNEGEQLVVVQEITRPKRFDREVVLREAVSALVENLQVTPHAVVLVRSGSLPKTSSGKLRRRDVQQAFLAGDLQELLRWQSGQSSESDDQPFESPETPVEKQVAQLWLHQLGVASVGRSDDFFSLGGSSLLVSQMITTVNETFGIDLPLHAIFHHPTLKGFSRLVQDSDHASSTKISPSEIADDQLHPLSAAQQRIWLLSRLEQTDAFLNVPVSVQLSGSIDRTELQRALNVLVQRHAALRTSLVESTQGPKQVIANETTFGLQSLEADNAAMRESFSNAPFDLSQAPLMRVAVTTSANGDDRIDLVFHHAICDAGSVAVLLDDLHRILANEEQDAQASSLRYVDFASWDGGEEHASQIEDSLGYWQERLGDVPPVIQLPCDMTTACAELDAPVRHANIAITGQHAKRIQQAAAKQGVTPSMVFLTAFQTVLSRYCGEKDFGILIPSSNRAVVDLEQVVGCYVNPIVYRAQIDPQQTLVAALANTRDHLLADLEHADVPFQRVVETISHDRSADRMPLAQTMFLYQPSLQTIESLGQAKVLSVTPDYSAVTAYDLSLIVHPVDQGFEVSLINGEHCDHATAARILASLAEVLGQAASCLESDDTALEIAQLELPAADERSTLRQASQGPAMDAANECLLNRLEHFATTKPSAIAIQDDECSLSYGDLESQSNVIAQGLRDSGVTIDSLVGIRLPRGRAMTVAILSVWKAGGGYVPLSDELPESRLNDMVDDANLSLIIDSETFSKLQESAGDNGDSLPALRSDGLAYAIYTSGSSGKPKGVAIEHRSVANLLASFASELDFTDANSMLALTTLSFDISVLELFLPLWCGATSRITACTVASDPDAVIETIQSSGVSHVQATPSTVRMLLSSDWKPRQGLVVLSGGEALTPDIAAELLELGCVLWNVYGPTETTVWSAVQLIDDANDITIGHPIANTQLIVVDDQMRQTPIGVMGELCIGGLGLARGYLNRDDLTSEKFVWVDGQRLYRTGDVARLREDGQLDFLARNDRQVKLRGFRIELDEIESVLQRHRSVERAAVVLDQSNVANPRLIAFCQLGDELISAEALESFVAIYLPAYMIPVVTFVHSMPRSPAGKTNYAALSFDSPKWQTNLESDAPKTPLESSLAEVWCDVLSCEKVGRNDNFFHMGGNSLLAAQLFARLRERFKMDLPLREVYQRPTIASLSELIVQRQSLQQPNEFNELLDQIETLSDEEALRILGRKLGSDDV